MLFRLAVAMVVVACAAAFFQGTVVSNSASMKMSWADVHSRFAKAAGVAAMGVALASPIALPTQPARADGAVSAATVYRARTGYGNKIRDLKAEAEKGNFAAFDNQKTKNAFDLFISGSNAQKSVTTKARAAVETDLKNKIFAAAAAKDAAGLKAAYNEFYKVADLKEDFKPSDLGQTGSSGYELTWGTDRQYIYQR